MTEKILCMIVLTYVVPLEQVDSLIPPHVEYLERHYLSKDFICSGRRIPRLGGIILAHVENEEKAWEIVKQDPFYIEGIAKFEVFPFRPNRFDERILSLFQTEKEISILN